MSEFADYLPRPDVRRPPLGESGLGIRPAVESELEAIAGIAAEREGEPVERWREIFDRIHAESRDTDRSILLVAEHSGRIVGYGKAAYFVPPEESPPNVAPEGFYLTGVVVRPEHRRRGVGAGLTRERLAVLAGRASVAYYFANARNLVTIDLHRRLGFVEVTRDFWLPGARFEGGVGILFRCDLTVDRG